MKYCNSCTIALYTQLLINDIKNYHPNPIKKVVIPKPMNKNWMNNNWYSQSIHVTSSSSLGG